jgi:hypothetical protein
VSIRQATSSDDERISRHTAVGQPDVEDGDIGADCRHSGERQLHGVGLADHLDVFLGVEQLSHAATHHFVVVEEEHPNDARAVHEQAA